jgi:hypothetical protein
MGVSCRIPNSIGCDRVGLSVWLSRPASVTATVAGARLMLNDPTWSYVVYHGHKPLYVYASFVQPAGITTRLRVTRNPISCAGWSRWFAWEPRSHSKTTCSRWRFEACR